MLVVAGTRLSREDVLTLAGMLTRHGSDRAARILIEAVVHGRVFVALTTEERESLLAVLDRPPASLAALRGALFDELNWQREGLVPPSRSREAKRVNVAWV